MSIETQIMVTLAAVEVADDYAVELTTRDPLTLDAVTVSLTWTQAVKLADELLAAVGEAADAVRDEERDTVTHGFDVDLVLCRDCREGKCGACIGSAFVERGADVDEVKCECLNPMHRDPGPL